MNCMTVTGESIIQVLNEKATKNIQVLVEFEKLYFELCANYRYSYFNFTLSVQVVAVSVSENFLI